MRITDINRQKRDGYFSIFVDDEFRFSLTDLNLSNSGLRVGQELTETEVEAWRKKSGESKALGFGYRYLVVRARSTAELAKYLQRKGFEPTEINYAVSRLLDEGLLGDSVFASEWVAMRQRTAPRSRNRLQSELRQKGLGRDEIDVAILQLDSDETCVVTELIERKRLLLRYANAPDKLVAYLARQGFGYDAIKKALAIGRTE